MSKITYKIVKHDGGWAYEANGTFSEPFPTRAQIEGTAGVSLVFSLYRGGWSEPDRRGAWSSASRNSLPKRMFRQRRIFSQAGQLDKTLREGDC